MSMEWFTFNEQQSSLFWNCISRESYWRSNLSIVHFSWIRRGGEKMTFGDIGRESDLWSNPVSRLRFIQTTWRWFCRPDISGIDHLKAFSCLSSTPLTYHNSASFTNWLVGLLKPTVYKCKGCGQHKRRRTALLSRLLIPCLFLRMQLKNNQSVSVNFKTFSTPWLNHNGRGTVIFHHLTVLSPAADGLICIFHFSFSPYSRTSSPSSSWALSSWSAWWWRGGELTYCGRSSQLSQAGFCMRTLPLITIIFIITIISTKDAIAVYSLSLKLSDFHSIGVSGPS